MKQIKHRVYFFNGIMSIDVSAFSYKEAAILACSIKIKEGEESTVNKIENLETGSISIGNLIWSE